MKQLVINSESRYISYKNLLEQGYKLNFPNWFKEYLREMKTLEESWLKKLKIEYTELKNTI